MADGPRPATGSMSARDASLTKCRASRVAYDTSGKRPATIERE